MRLAATVIVLDLSLALGCLACSSDAPPLGDAGAGDDADAVDGRVDEPDAPPPPLQADAGPAKTATMFHVATTTANATCAQACNTLGFSCITACTDGAGLASYGYYDWTYGFYRPVEVTHLAACDQNVPRSVTVSGETYDLGSLDCCCEAPAVTEVSGAMSEVRACDEVCRANGYSACANFHQWPEEDFYSSGGALCTYERPETGSVTRVVMGCEAVPPATKYIAGAQRQLSRYDCACF